jgi:hypothetical protein
VNIGRTLYEGQQIIGHSDPTVIRRYTQLVLVLAQIVEILPVVESRVVYGLSLAPCGAGLSGSTAPSHASTQAAPILAINLNKPSPDVEFMVEWLVASLFIRPHISLAG